jgi:hypothetical protein
VTRATNARRQLAADRRRRFAEGLAVGLSGADAAEAAGFGEPRRSLRVRAQQLRRHPDVASHLAALIEARLPARARSGVA